MTHPDILSTIMNMAMTYNRCEDFTKSEEMYRLALDGYVKTLGKGHKDTKQCAKNMAILLIQDLEDKDKIRILVKEHPSSGGTAPSRVFSEFY